MLLNLFPVCEKATRFSLEVENKHYPLPALEILTLPKQTEIATPPHPTLRLPQTHTPRLLVACATNEQRRPSGGRPVLLRQAGTAEMFQNSLHSLAGISRNFASARSHFFR